MHRWIALAFVFISIAGAAQTGIDQDLQTAVNSANQAWIDGMRRGDAAGIVATYAADGVYCSADGQCILGATAIQQLFASRTASMGRARTANVSTTSLVRDRDLAYEWGIAEASFGGGRNLYGRYLTVWQHQPDGGWKILRNMVLPTGRERGAGYPRRTEQSSTIRCESNDGGRHSCAATAEISRAEILRQVSGSPCTKDRSWGWEGNSVWVDRGCRAEFTVYTYTATAAPADVYRTPPADEGMTEYNDPRFTKTVRCESEDMNYRFCPADGTVRSARLVRQLSGSGCTETRTWGWKSDGVWVDKGCRAEFELVVR